MEKAKWPPYWAFFAGPWERSKRHSFSSVSSEEIKLDAKSRDDIPALLKGLQHIYADKETRAELFALLEAHIRPDRSVGRPGMEMWKILVMGVLKQGLGCDRLQELANQHKTVRQGHSDFADETYYEY